jgi:hypothetical protein
VAHHRIQLRQSGFRNPRHPSDWEYRTKEALRGWCYEKVHRRLGLSWDPPTRNGILSRKLENGLAEHKRHTQLLSLSNLISCPKLCPSVPGVGWMCVSTGLYFLIQSCNSSIDTAGPAGASDKTFGHDDAHLDGCVNTYRQWIEIP